MVLVGALPSGMANEAENRVQRWHEVKKLCNREWCPEAISKLASLRRCGQPETLTRLICTSNKKRDEMFENHIRQPSANPFLDMVCVLTRGPKKKLKVRGTKGKRGRMRKLNFQLKKMCERNRDGSFATRHDRQRELTLIANQLFELGFQHMEATSFKPKHVDSLVRRWQSENLSTGTIKNRMSALRW
jgi:hypothetical protein